jgi:hypothetical protein
MVVQISPPITIPARPQVVYDTWFFTAVNIQASPGSASPNGTLSFTRTPMVGTTGELLPSHAETIQVDLAGALTEVPTAAAALTAILTALPDVHNHFSP